jgi:hypothetical protein
MTSGQPLDVKIKERVTKTKYLKSQPANGNLPHESGMDDEVPKEAQQGVNQGPWSGRSREG